MIKLMNLKEKREFSIDSFLLNRLQDHTEEYEKIVSEIILTIKEKKDKALLGYTEKFDGVKLSAKDLKVSQEEINDAYDQVDDGLIRIIRRARDRIAEYHEKQKRTSWFDTDESMNILGQKITPIEKVGVYVPGGKAIYPSSVLMNIVPAKVAGVKKIVAVTPPQKDGSIHPLILVAAKEAGVTEIYKVGGAQAIAALAYGTETIPKVYKIVGPGNIFVATAKKAVYGDVSIDSVAGPSEILVIADQWANPKYVAADLLSQAEHDELASAVLITDDLSLAKTVQEEVTKQTNELSRKEIIEKSLEDYGAIILVPSMKEAASLANEYAPEHLEICTQNPYELLPAIQNAGAIFLGQYSPEPLGDYMAGPNHVLPTCGTAKFFSPLNIDDFIKKSSIIGFTKESLKEFSEDIIYFAEAEQLTAHANAVRVRFND